MALINVLLVFFIVICAIILLIYGLCTIKDNNEVQGITMIILSILSMIYSIYITYQITNILK